MEDKKDGLDELMRSRLLNDQPAPNKWNVPPDHLFEEAMRALPPRKKRRRYFLWLPLLFGIALAAYYVLRTEDKINRLHTELTELKDQKAIDETSNELALDQSKLQVESKNTATLKTADNRPTRSPNNPIVGESVTGLAQALDLEKGRTKNGTDLKQAASINKSSNYPVYQVDVGAPVRNVQTQADEYHARLNDDGQAQNHRPTELASTHPPIINNAASNEAIEQLFVSVIPLLALHQISGSFDAINIQAPTPVIQKDNARISRKWTVRVFAGPNFSHFKMKAMEQTAFSLSGYDENQIGLRVGVGSSYKLNDKLSLVGTVDFTRHNNKSYFQDIMRYQKNAEVVENDGRRFYTSDVIIESPMHTMKEKAKFEVEEDEIQDNDIIKNKTRIEQNINIISAGLGLNYRLVEINKVSLGLGVGARMLHLQKMKDQWNMELYHQDKMMIRKEEVGSSLEDVNRNVLATYGAVIISYPLSDRLAIGARGEYEYAWNSMRKSMNSSEPTTYLRSWDLSLGMHYRF